MLPEAVRKTEKQTDLHFSPDPHAPATRSPGTEYRADHPFPPST